jgi:TonB family protein
MRQRFWIVVLTALSTNAQAPTGAAEQSATSLIERVAKSASETASWRIEGSVSYVGVNNPETVPFGLIAHSPNQLRFQQLGSQMPAVIVCDGTTAWVYSPPLEMYSKAIPIDSPDCSLIIGSWRKLTKALEAPALSGKCGADPASESGEYELIRGTSKPDPPITGQLRRTLCIDPSRSLIVWEKAELRNSARVYVYSKVERNVDVPPGAFRFDPPNGVELVDVELPLPHPLGSRGSLSDPGIIPPRLLSKKEPKYDERARNARVEGTTVLWAIIGVDGLATHIKVFRALNPGLDAEAVKALKAWRFEPGKVNGVAHPTQVTVEMNFRLK